MGVGISVGMIELLELLTLILAIEGPVEVMKYVPEGPDVIADESPPDITGGTNK
jgi:hypothetical protein